MLKDAVSAPDYFKARYTRHDRQMLSDKLNRTFEEQCRSLVQFNPSNEEIERRICYEN
jgi:hypothetical protein